jgi:mannose-6-phosphate isomerase-like protein (cupin superfamily)
MSTSVPVQRLSESNPKHEYGCLLRRIVPTHALVSEAPWGTAWATVDPGTQTEPHAHDEEEIFIILRGRGVLEVDGAPTPLEATDVVRIPRNARHTLRNSAAEPLEFLTIYWDGEPSYRAR